MARKAFSPALLRLSPRDSLDGSPGYSLRGINTTGLPDGTLCWVESEQDDFRLLRTSSAAAGTDVVVPGSGPGRWHRASVAAAVATQDWYIDPASGSDANSGLDASDALASHTGWLRRIGRRARITQHTRVHILSDLNEAVTPDVHITAEGTLNYIAGVTATLATGTVTQVGGPAPSTVQLSGVADWDTGGTGGTSLIGELLRDTVTGAQLWLAKKLVNPAEARASTGLIWNETTMSGMASSALGNGNVCVVEKRAAIMSLDFSNVTVDSYRVLGVPTNPLHMAGFRVAPGRVLNLAIPNLFQPLFVRCLFPNFVRISNSTVWMDSCRFAGSSTASIVAGAGANLKLARTCAHTAVKIEPGGTIWLANAGLLQGAYLEVHPGGTLWAGNFDVYDTSNYAVRVRGGGIAQLQAGLMSGTVTSGVVLWVEGGGLCTYQATNVPAAAGAVAGQDFRLGRLAAAPQAWAALGATGVIDPATGAAVLPYDD